MASSPGPVTLNSTRRALDSRVSLDSIERFARHLEEPYLLFFVDTYSFSKGKRKRSPRKVYAMDNGLLLAVSHRFSSDRGLVITLNQSETMHVAEGVIEFLPYRRWALEVARWCG